MPLLSAIGYTLLSWLCQAYAVVYYALYILPRTAWLHYTGQIPPPPALPRHLPIRLRERAWCTVCERVLETGSVRCPAHPDGEVLMLLRDEEDD
jgi:hypothetical protein